MVVNDAKLGPVWTDKIGTTGVGESPVSWLDISEIFTVFVGFVPLDNVASYGGRFFCCFWEMSDNTFYFIWFVAEAFTS